MRHNSQSLDVRRWTKRRLISEAKSLHHMIFVVDCFGTNDLFRYDAAVAELERRGYGVTTAAEFGKRG